MKENWGTFDWEVQYNIKINYKTLPRSWNPINSHECLF